jgi:hypothetical protein
MPSEALEPLPSPDVLPTTDNPIPSLIVESESDVISATSPSDIQALVDAPLRTLEVEYKSWRNLSNIEDCAELVRDIAALANHGGGYIIFGFNQDTLTADDPYQGMNCTEDEIATVVRTYLDPPVRCELAIANATSGHLHLVIRVPSHGSVPVCVRKDGPLVGKTRLVERGVYYVRKHETAIQGKYIGVPRPQTGRIETPQEWASLIRRCVRQDREILLAMIEASIEDRKLVLVPAERLMAWHIAAHNAFLGLVPLSPVAEQLAHRHYALSYGFELVGQEMLEHAQLPELLRRVVFEVEPMFGDVLNMFDPPYRRSVKARFAVDDATGDGETDFLEVAWLRDRPPTETADFWRLSPYGFATIVRDYAEDRTEQNRQLGAHPGTWFSPNILVQEIAELVCHARALMRFFASVRRVHFRCEWWGLAGRELFDPYTSWAHRSAATDDHRVVTLQVPGARLAQAWPDVVAQIMAPVLRAFEPDLALGPDWVRGQLSRAEKHEQPGP